MKISDLMPTLPRFLTASGDRPTEMHFTAPVEITAAEPDKDGGQKVPRFSITAYSGGAMRVPQFALPVVVELKGARAARRGVKVLRDHDTSKIVGHTDSVEIDDKGIRAAGPVSGSGEHANEIVASSRNGFPWEASIGARKLRMELVASGRSVQVNGRSFQGPLFVARQSEIHEISFVALGADDETSASVAATAENRPQGGTPMKFKDWLKAKGIEDYDALSKPVQEGLEAAWKAENEADPPASNATNGGEATAGTNGSQATASAAGGSGQNGDGSTVTAQAGVQEMVASAVRDAVKEAQTQWQRDQEHRSAITRITAGHPELQAKALEENWSAEKAELEVIKASRPAVGNLYVNTGAGSDVAPTALITAAICQAGNLASVEKDFDDKTLQAAHTRYRGRVGLKQILLEAAWQGGYTGSHFDQGVGGMQEILRAAFSTFSLPGILSNSANKFLLQGFMNVEQSWRAISAIRNVNDFKKVTSYRMTGDFQFKEVGADGELKHGKHGEESFENQARTYGIMSGITRQDIINDDLGALTATPMRIGRGGALKLNDVFWTKFLANHGTFFTSGRGNYITGASTALSIEGLTEAETAFLRQKDPDKKPLGVRPDRLLVPPELATPAREINVSSGVNTGGSSSTDRVPNNNVFSGRFPPVVSSYLTSSLEWYLLANPDDLAMIETVFLNGVQQPTVETADADFETLGVRMRGFWDFGVEKQDHRAAVKSKGEA